MYCSFYMGAMFYSLTFVLLLLLLDAAITYCLHWTRNIPWTAQAQHLREEFKDQVKNYSSNYCSYIMYECHKYGITLTRKSIVLYRSSVTHDFQRKLLNARLYAVCWNDFYKICRESALLIKAQPIYFVTSSFFMSRVNDTIIN